MLKVRRFNRCSRSTRSARLRCLLPLLITGLVPVAGHAQTESAHPSPTPWTVFDIYHPAKAKEAAPAETAWSPDGTRLSYRMPDGALGAIDARTGARTVLTPGDKLAGVSKRPINEKDRDHRARYNQGGYFWSPDGAQILFDEDGTLWLDSLKTGEVRQVGDTGQGSGDDVKFSPDGAAISYLHNHNLYVQRGSGKPVALTGTADPNLLNGEVDWVYLEELKSRSNYTWAPDSAHLAYIQMDETHVPVYPLTDFNPTHATVDQQKYPQAGDPNPTVRVGVVAATGGDTRWIDLPGVRPDEDYIPRIGWLDAKTVWVETLARDHKHLDLWFADARTGRARKVLSQQDAKFFNDTYDVDCSRPGHVLLLSWQSGHAHINHYTYADPATTQLKPEARLESGDYEVADIASVVGDTVYYTSNEGEPLGQQVWAVQLDGTGKHQVTQGKGIHRVAFAEAHAAFTDNYSSLTTPPALSLCSAGSACAPLWHDPGPGAHAVRTPELLTLKAADGQTTIYATLLLPAAGQGSSASQPLITNPYGGPGSPGITNSWGGPALYFDDLLAEHGFAVLHVRNRGMHGQGRAFEQAAYHDFGAVQLADQLAAIDQVLARYPQLDPKRLGWWGWSWGGTFTLNAMTHSDRFRAGVSVAPVTDFRNYDSIYTERYLGLPVARAGEPAEASVYDAAAVLSTAAKLHGHLLLVHGTGDDNVHMANTIQFVQKLVDADKPYDLQLYPRKTHSIAGPDARTHLYERILAQFEQYLKPEQDPR
ncbi:DPP IV N-terminal domain-containing protein [Acidipila sp. EB88]|uniref:S9 family peptidase n=1 Tax=Acidipila sp. EB88 TaxID=2305226 RepID=UPI000F5F179D|nr:DPP IV N-terminal domain-containing protein [Acidipila sp. EB88]RRA48531.1 dipeptidyl-peptidase IV [Acidipila sp. EB88]